MLRGGLISLPEHTKECAHTYTTHNLITPSIFKVQFDEWLILLYEQRAVGGSDLSLSLYFFLSDFLSVCLSACLVSSESW